MSESVWFLHYNFTQHGPFTVPEIKAFLAEGTISPKTFAWRKGMRDWTRILDTPELLMELGGAVEKTRTRTRTRGLFRSKTASKRTQSKTKSKSTTGTKIEVLPPVAAAETAAVTEVAAEAEPDQETQASRDSRASPRKPLVAHVVFTDQNMVSMGLCKDISENGVLVLTDTLPGSVGAPITVNISPSDSTIPPFKAVGRVARIFDGTQAGGARGYALRFERLGEKERSHLSEFLKKS